MARELTQSIIVDQDKGCRHHTGLGPEIDSVGEGDDKTGPCGQSQGCCCCCIGGGVFTRAWA